MDGSRRRRNSPRQTPPGIQYQVMETWAKTGHGRRRVARYLARQGRDISPHTRSLLSFILTDRLKGASVGTPCLGYSAWDGEDIF